MFFGISFVIKLFKINTKATQLFGAIFGSYIIFESPINIFKAMTAFRDH